jgi:hypothetical protein
MLRLDVEVKIRRCGVWNVAVVAFVECLHTDRGPVTLYGCHIESRIIASALTGDSRVTRFRPRPLVINDAYMAVLFMAL